MMLGYSVMFQQIMPPRHKDADNQFLDWISRQRYCVTCGGIGVYHEEFGEYLLNPSHIRSRGAGGQDVGNVIPQCAKCHARWHNGNLAQSRHELQDMASIIGEIWLQIAGRGSS